MVSQCRSDIGILVIVNRVSTRFIFYPCNLESDGKQKAQGENEIFFDSFLN